MVPLPADRFLWTSFSSYSAANYSDPVDRMQSLSRACLAVRQQFGPKTVNNFVFLAREKFYDGTVFHRVIDNFMIQGGDPTGIGRGGPGYRFEDEGDNPHKHQVGSLSMAN